MKRTILLPLIAAVVTVWALMTILGRGDTVPPQTPSRRMRDLYSLHPTSDPYVLGQQRKVAEALERECSASGTHCAEAKAARAWMEQNDGSLVH